MFCTEYDLPAYNGGFIADGHSRNDLANIINEQTSRTISLENEIRALRSEMEQLFLQEQSFTSDNVIQISTLLDLKINEYMKFYPKKTGIMQE